MQLFIFSSEHDALLIQKCRQALSPAWISFIPADLLSPSGTATKTDVFDMVLERMESVCDRFAFFGHRSGSLAALELSYRLMRAGVCGPVHLFISGANAPHVYSPHYSARNWEPLPCRLSIIAGKQDPEVATERLGEWSRYTRQRCDIHLLNVHSGQGKCDAVGEGLPKDRLQIALSILEREYSPV